MAEAKTHTDFKPNDTIRAEQAKAEVTGRDKAPIKDAKSEPAKGQRQDDRDRLDQERHRKSGIGNSRPVSQTGEPGRARDELGEKTKSPAMQPG